MSSPPSTLFLPRLLFCALLISSAAGRRPTPIKTIDGDIFDCVDIHKQPAFEHPLLKHHKILTKPDVSWGADRGGDDDRRRHATVEGGGCPVGTVPIHRLPQQQSLNTTHLGIQPSGTQQRDDDPFDRMWAVKASISGVYYGASAELNVYGVHPMGPQDVSGAAVWVQNQNQISPDQTPIIRAGWAVFPSAFGDYKTRLFVMWSGDDDRTPCLNLQCPGFVQTSRDVRIGGVIWPLSGYQGAQYYISVYLFKDNQNNWWFAYNNTDTVAGYWPAELFGGRFEEASRLEYGGAVSCPKGGQCPPMGNGHNPRGGLGELARACHVWRVQAVYDIHGWDNLHVTDQTDHVNDPRCYNLGLYLYANRHYKFTFGGPFCPPASASAETIMSSSSSS